MRLFILFFFTLLHRRCECNNNQTRILFMAPQNADDEYQLNNFRESFFSSNRFLTGWLLQANKPHTISLYLATDSLAPSKSVTIIRNRFVASRNGTKQLFHLYFQKEALSISPHFSTVHHII
mgnify:CR=1 FL=1